MRYGLLTENIHEKWVTYGNIQENWVTYGKYT